MRLRSLFAVFGVLLAFCASGALAAPDKAAKQAEIRKATHATLEKFYKAQPALKNEVRDAPGYAVFTTYGLSFLVGGSGGSGLAHERRTGTITYMSMAQATAGLHAGIGEKEVLIVFKTDKAYKEFVDKGWDIGGGAAMAGGAEGKTAGGGAGEQFLATANYFTLTKSGIEVGGVVSGTKFWKDKDLN